MGEQAELVVNLLTNEGAPRRPTKRLRPETTDTQVLSLVDSDDDGVVFNPRPRDTAGQATERHAAHPRMTTYWGALEDGPRGAAEAGRPVYRPPSARFRRQPVPQQARQSANPSPIVIDDDDDSSPGATAPPRPALFRRFTGLMRQPSASVEDVGVGSGSPQALNARALPGALAASGSGLRDALPSPEVRFVEAFPSAHQQQQEQQELPSEQGAVLQPRPRRQPLHLTMARQTRRLPGAAAAGGPSTAAAATGASSSVSTALPRSLEGPDHHRQQLQQQQLQLQQLQQQVLQQQRQQQQMQRRQQQMLLRNQEQRQLEALAADEDQEEADMRLAARLQAEEDERLARETAMRMEQEDHHRLMAAVGGAGAATATAAAGAALAAAGGVPVRRLWRAAGSAGGSGEASAGAGAANSEADAADLAARWSRLDMLETLESAAEADRARRSAAAAMAAAESQLAARHAADRAAVETRGVDADRGPDRDGDRDRDRNREFINMWRMARPGRGGASGLPGMMLVGGLPGEAAAGEVAPQDGPTGPAGGPGAGRPRWSSRTLQDMLPAMMAGFPYGLQRMWIGPGGGGGRAAEGDEGPGAAYQSHRRSRQMAAYRESAMAMREQLIAAQRAGLPPHLLLSDRDFTPEDYEMLCRLDDAVENRKGAKDEQLVAMPTEAVGAEGRRRSDGSPATCIICMEELAPGDVMKRLPCMHDFHSGCVDTWLKTKACCPVCQRELDA